MDNVEYLIRIVLRARDEMAGAFARARTEVQGLDRDLKALDGTMNKVNERISSMNRRLGNVTAKLKENRSALENWSSRLRGTEGDVTAVGKATDATTERTKTFGVAVRSTDRDASGFIGTLGRWSRELSRAGTNVASLGHEMRGLVIVGAIVFLQQLNAVVVSLAGSLVSVASSAAMAGAALGAGLAAGAAQAIPVIGLLIGAFSRVGAIMDAVQQRTNALQQEQTQAATGANQQADATNRLTGAHEALEAAQRRHQDSLRQVAEAQKDLLQAQKNRRLELEELILAERRAELASRGAALSQAEARRALSEAVRTGAVGDVAGAQLDVDEAALGRDEAGVGLTRARQARAGGAREDLDRAREALRDARRAAQDSARTIAQARRDLRAAGADAIRISDTGVAAARNLDYLLSQLSRSERRLFNGIVRLKEAYEENFRPITDIIVDSFSRAVNRVTDLLGDRRLLGPFRGLATSLSETIDSWTHFLSGDRSIGFFARMTKEAARSNERMSATAQKFFEVFMRVAEAGIPVWRFMLRTFDRWADSLLGATDSQSQLNDFFEEGIGHLNSWIQLFEAVIGLFIALAGPGGAADEGKNTIDRLTSSIEQATVWVQTHTEDVRNFFKEAREGTEQIARVIWELGKTMARVFGEDGSQHVESLANILIEVLLPAVESTAKVVGYLIERLEDFLTLPVIGDITKWVVTFLLLSKIGATFVGLIGGMVFQFVRLAVVIRGAVTAIGAARAAMVAFGTGAGIKGAIDAWKQYVAQARAARTATQEVGAAQTATTAAATGRAQPGAGGTVILPDGREVVEGSPAHRQSIENERRNRRSIRRRFGRFGRGAGRVAGGVGGTLGVLGVIGAASADEETFGDLGLGERWQQGLGTASFGVIPGLRTTDERLKTIIERIKEAKSVLKMDDITPDWDDFTEAQQRVIRRAVRLRNEQILVREEFDKTFKGTATRESVQAMLNNFERLRKGVDSTYPNIRKTVLDNLRLIAQNMDVHSKRGQEKVAENFRLGLRNIKSSVEDGVISVRDGYKLMRELMRNHSGAGKDAAIKNLQEAQDFIAATMQRNGRVTERGMRRIRRLMVQELKLYGFSAEQAQNVAETGDIAGRNIRGEGYIGNRAGGGWIGKRGERGRDGGAYIGGYGVGRGELLVANAAQQGLLENALQGQYGMNLNDLVNRVKGAHAGELGPYGWSGGYAGRSPAGLRTVPIPGFPGEFIARNVLDEAMQLIRRFRLMVTDAFATAGHSGKGHLFYGTAMDAVPGPGGSWDMVDRAVAFARSKGLTVLYDGVPNHGRGHHAHFELADGAKLGVRTAAQFRRKLLRQINADYDRADMGAVGEAGRGAQQAVARGALRRFREALRNMGPEGVEPDSAKYRGGVLSRGEVVQIINQAMRIVGVPGNLRGDWRAMALPRAWQESRFNPNAVNNWDSNAARGDPSRGLFQTIMSTFKGNALPGMNNIFNPLHNAVAAFRYMLSAYGNGSWAQALQSMLGRAGVGYAAGGELPGPHGRPFPIVAHGREWIINEMQKLKLARLAGTSVDRLRGLLGFTGGPTEYQGGGETRRGALRRDPGELLEEFLAPAFGARGAGVPRWMQRLITELWDDIGESVRLVHSGVRRGFQRLTALTREGGMFDQARELLDRYIGRRATRLLENTFNLVGGRPRRVLTDEQIAERTASQAGDIVGRERGLLSNMRRALPGARRLTMRSTRDVERSERRIRNLTERIKEEDDKEKKEELEKELKEEKERLARRKRRNQRSRAGLNNLRNRIEAQQQTVAEAIQAWYEALIDWQNQVVSNINQGFEDRLSGLDREERVLRATGRSSAVGGLFARREQTLREQQAALQGQVAGAAALGNWDLVRELQNQIAELGVEITETVAEGFQFAIEQVNIVAQRGLSLLDTQIRIVELKAQIGGYDPTQQIKRLVEGQRRVLETQRAGLMEQMLAARRRGDMDAINDLKQQLADNELALLENTIQLQELNNQYNQQTFSSRSWEWFRQAVFTGTNQLLPEYQFGSSALVTVPSVPVQQQPANVVAGGMTATPWGGATGDKYASTNVTINQAGENLDVPYLIDRLEFERKAML